ncbi:hypothetical protein [Comamonas sp. NoAH]|uniref:hypothetical protein n=1 Tax=Comamonas halotolerans TaxID=3041496 RepID=UPI0024E09D9F|nr:hypothetical protein [Comamonas sp. NoAH]
MTDFTLNLSALKQGDLLSGAAVRSITLPKMGYAKWGPAITTTQTLEDSTGLTTPQTCTVMAKADASRHVGKIRMPNKKPC